MVLPIKLKPRIKPKRRFPLEEREESAILNENGSFHRRFQKATILDRSTPREIEKRLAKLAKTGAYLNETPFRKKIGKFTGEIPNVGFALRVRIP